MNYLLDREQSLEIDKISIEEYKIPSIVLMENAGAKTATWINKILKKNKRKKIVVIAGAGNNGGDSYVVFRHLKNMGYNIDLILMRDREKIEGDALINLDILYNLNSHILDYDSTLSLNGYNIIVDAIFGVGLTRNIEGVYEEVIEKINSSTATKISIDISSGIDASTGKIMGVAVKSDYTATYGYLKIGHIFRKDLSGKVKVFDISFPKEIIKKLNKVVHYLEEIDIKKRLPIRKFDSHKYNNGNLLLIGGSIGKVGAIIMSSKSSLRSGVGVATLLTSDDVIDSARSNLIEVMVESYKTLDDIKRYLDKKTAIAIGPGINIEYATLDILEYLITKKDIPMVIDADGLNIISNFKRTLLENNRDKEIVITPHIKEFSRLTKMSIKDISENRINVVSYWAKKWKITIVLKGANSIIASKNGEIYINSTGNNGMATAGSGDVLTGIISTFLSQKISGVDSAILGVYIHGLAGDLAVNDLGNISLIATDIIKYLPLAFMKFQKKI